VAEKLRILQVNTNEISGGAQRVAWNLFRSYRSRGYGSWLAVGHRSGNPDVLVMSHGLRRSGWSRFWWSLHERCQSLDGNGRVSRWVQLAAEPRAILDYYWGIENFHYPGAWNVLDMVPRFPDILHCHNLHGGYFDLRALSWLSHQLPTVITLHDAWLLSGHCAHSLNCERWRIGCGQCPDLSIYPAVTRDATAFNWQRKLEIYKNSRLYLAIPSRWLMQKVEESILSLSIAGARVIPNGVDLTVYHPDVDRRATRESLGLPQDRKILLFTANGIRANIWKDFRTLRSAISRVAASKTGQTVLFVGLGENGSPERIGQAEIHFVPYQSAPEAVARYYQAADIYIHAARADTFPNTILEALACGTPVIATAVGGIPEQVKGLRCKDDSANSYGLDQATGFLVSAGDGEELAARIDELLGDDVLRIRLSTNAAADVRQRFDLERQVEAYLDWYDAIRRDFDRDRACKPEFANAHSIADREKKNSLKKILSLFASAQGNHSRLRKEQ
jgi:glycosyltransferase involved in cell wall biosynthesis